RGIRDPAAPVVAQEIPEESRQEADHGPVGKTHKNGHRDPEANVHVVGSFEGEDVAEPRRSRVEQDAGDGGPPLAPSKAQSLPLDHGRICRTSPAARSLTHHSEPFGTTVRHTPSAADSPPHRRTWMGQNVPWW